MSAGGGKWTGLSALVAKGVLGVVSGKSIMSTRARRGEQRCQKWQEELHLSVLVAEGEQGCWHWWLRL